MGWLKALLERANIRSVNALATAMVEATPDLKDRLRFTDVRSLGNRLREADKGADKALLGEEGFAALLSRHLGVSEDELLRLQRESFEGESPHVADLIDLGPAVRIDLAKERIFPGIPEKVLSPRAWNRVWWLAHSGAGRKLVYRKLKAVDVAVYRAETWRSATLPPERPLYVLLERWDGEVKAQDVPAGVCIAAPFLPVARALPTPAMPTPLPLPVPPPAPTSSDTSVRTSKTDRRPEHPESAPTFEFVTTASIGEWLNELLHWVEDRLGSKGGFDREAVERFVRRSEGAFQTPGHVLALCGLADVVGAEKLTRRDFTTLARHYMDLAVARLPGIDPKLERALLGKNHALEVVLSICKGFLCAVETDPSDGLPLEMIEAFLPDRLKRLADVEGARAVLASGKEPAAVVAQLQEKLGPEAPTVARTLAEIRLLERLGDGYRMRPWVQSLAALEVVRRIVDEGQADLGEALLRPHAAPLVLDELLSRFATGTGGLLDAATNQFDAANPASVAAFEGCFRAAGIAVLCGASLPTETLHRAWAKQFAGVDADAFPEPPAPEPEIGWLSDDPWLTSATWFLACLAISEVIGAVIPPSLAPWERGVTGGTFMTLLSAGGVWEHPQCPAWAMAGFDLGRRLLERRGQVEGFPPLLIPAVTAAAVRNGTALPDSGSREGPCGAVDVVWISGRSRPWLAPFKDQAERAGVPFEDVVRALWDSWGKNPGGTPSFGALSDDERRVLWQLAPADLFKGPLFDVVLGGLRPDHLDRSGKSSTVPLDALNVEQWTAFMSAWWAKADAFGNPLEPWNHVPEEVVVEATRAGQFNGPNAIGVRPIIWGRFPAALLRVTVARIEAGDLGAIRGVPWQHWPAIFEPVRGQSESSDSGDSNLVQAWLREYVWRRLPGWRAAFALLAHLRSLPEPPKASQGKRPKK